ncbi:MAG: DUF2179 domain-containing protein [Candidatus Lokiarchaeota archaeon]|nr:DUF2179 domain-containing protein [Candidatus Lokiarchaeota archaeon]
MDIEIFSLIILPILIFAARVSDVSIGTMRIIFISQGNRKLAPLAGFFEVTIWLLAMGQIFNNLTNPIYYIAYASGFAMGNYVGLVIEQKLSLGLLSLYLIIKDDPQYLVKELKTQGYGLTTLTAEGMKGNVKLLVMIIKRKDLNEVYNLIKSSHPDAFMSVQNVQSVKGAFLGPKQKVRWALLGRKKGK